MKKLLFLFLTGVFTLCLTATSFANVKLLRGYAFTGIGHSSTGSFPSYTRTVFVKVQDLGSDKTVQLHAEFADGSWNDTGYASYVGPASEAGWDIYRISDSVGDYNGNVLFGDEFVVKYEVNGNTYWDNNNGNNFILEASDEILGSDINVLSDSTRDYLSTSTIDKKFYVEAILKNLAYSKNVTVVYTTDNWATQNEASLEFMEYTSFSGRYSYPVYYPTAGNVERWSASVDVDSSITEVTYYLKYEVNGQTYYDSNLGQNYILN